MPAWRTGLAGAAVLLGMGMLFFSGCGPSEKQGAQEILRHGLAHAQQREFYKAIGEFELAEQDLAKARQLGCELE